MENVLSKNPCYMTAAVAAAAKDRKTGRYLNLCITYFVNGFYGTLSDHDILVNRQALDQQEGSVFACYPAYGKLDEDIFIIGQFSRTNPCDLDQNNTTVLYASEY